MSLLRRILVLLVTIALALLFTISKEDVPRTLYDESVSLPYVGTPLFCIASPKVLSQAPAKRIRVSMFGLVSRHLNSHRSNRDLASPILVSDCFAISDHPLRC